MNYCTNSKFLNLLKLYQKTKDKRIGNEIGKIFISIAKRFLIKPRYIDYTDDWKDEMISDATYYMWRFMDRFDLTKSNPFSYFTEVAKNAFKQWLNEKRKYENMFTSIDYIEFFKNSNDNILTGEHHE